MPNNIPLHGYTTFFLIHLLVEGHFSCVHLLAVKNNVVISIYVLVFVWINILISHIPRRRIAGSYGNSLFEELPDSFPKQLHHFTLYC